jgi:NADH-quinone oxidoreductase subunit C
VPHQTTLRQEAQLDHARAVAGALAADVYLHNGSLIVETTVEHLRALLLALRDDDRTRCEVLSYMTAVDYSPREPRFEVVYELYSIEQKGHLRVKLKVEDTGSEETLPEVPSIFDIYLAANWHEREAFDLMGIRFAGHPDLRRIVLPERWDGYPLRKEYPFDGKRVWRMGTTVVDGAHNRPDDLGLDAAHDVGKSARETIESRPSHSSGGGGA